MQDMQPLAGTAAPERRELIVCFLDLASFTRDASTRDEEDVATMIDAFYERVGDAAARAGGTVVKFIGDGALVTFPPERADDALAAILDLRQEIDRWLPGEGWSGRLLVKLHAGAVMAGGFGTRGGKRFDVIGNAVNVAATLPRPFHLSPQMFRLLSPAGRARVKKHTPPITYIPLGDPHTR